MKKTEMANLFDEMCDLAVQATPVVVSEDKVTGRKTESPYPLAACFAASALAWCSMVARGELEPKDAEEDLMRISEAAFRLKGLRDERDADESDFTVIRRKLSVEG